MNWSENIKLILSSGFSLENIGVNNWALDNKQALEVLDEFERQGIAVLGGDVYEIVDGIPESNYDNWYCEQYDDEPFLDFSKRSIAKAREYINNYKQSSSKSVMYTIVAEELQDQRGYEEG
ncbi:Immunity protein 40 [Desulfofustis glycolicus DSM 9705]|uniref:Immunity protein 40 n=2 Tax=Desulfofustis glycolicus TaxID=51195 RepID=A0A1M5YXE3_9BACT|nr:Immunity protein 40 [Desulfofustis glycolicus DSM 9705]